MRLALPTTKVTAMVSPSARPSASITPPMMPTLGVGDHDVLDDFPGGAAEAVGHSFSIAGTVSNTSRVMEVMKGSTMMPG